MPADWSSAAFPICAAAITESDILVKGLDLKDPQGDKQVIEHLKKMNAEISIEKAGIRIKTSKLKGAELDLNSTPDALPAMAVVACCAEGTTKIKNVAQARIKETDRIAVMAKELSKMRADIKELPDGLIIKKSRLKGAEVESHHDHRVAMALSLAGMAAEGETIINNAESINITFPSFIKKMKKLNAHIEVLRN